MNLNCLADLPARLQHPQVRDLAWALLSPPLLRDTPWPQRHPLAASRWNRHPGELADWLLHQDRQASVLQAWLAQSSIRRLGLYYERLWQYALYHAPDVQLLVANLPIRQQGQTLGELDLLLRDADGVHHVELAVKFYLAWIRATAASMTAGWGRAVMIAWTSSWRASVSINCRSPAKRRRARCWPS